MWDHGQALNRLATVADQQDRIANGELAAGGAPTSEAQGPNTRGTGAPLRGALVEAGPSDASTDVADTAQEETMSPSAVGAPTRQHAGAQPKQRGRKPASTDSYAQRHQAAEARRRNRINERIEALRKLVPNDPRANTASFLEEVIKYILNLQDNNEKLEAVLHALSQQQLQPQQQPQQQQQPELQQSQHNPGLPKQEGFSELVAPNPTLGGFQMPSRTLPAGLAPSLQLPMCLPLDMQLHASLPLQTQLLLLQQQQQQQSQQTQQLQQLQLQLQLQGASRQHALLQQQQQQQQHYDVLGTTAALSSNSVPAVSLLTQSNGLQPALPPPMHPMLLQQSTPLLQFAGLQPSLAGPLPGQPTLLTSPLQLNGQLGPLSASLQQQQQQQVTGLAPTLSPLMTSPLLPQPLGNLSANGAILMAPDPPLNKLPAGQQASQGDAPPASSPLNLSKVPSASSAGEQHQAAAGIPRDTR